MALACAAHLSAAAFAVTALVSSDAWRTGTGTASCLNGAGVLRFLASIAPVLIVFQVLLGSAYRHKLLGLIPHVIGAMTAGMLAFALAIFTIVACPGFRPVHVPARFVAGLLTLQILLGIGAALSRISEGEVAPLLALAPAAHVVIGSLTLAGSVILSIQILRNVQASAEELPSPGAAVAP